MYRSTFNMSETNRMLKANEYGCQSFTFWLRDQEPEPKENPLDFTEEVCYKERYYQLCVVTPLENEQVELSLFDVKSKTPVTRIVSKTTYLRVFAEDFYEKCENVERKRQGL